MFALPSLNERKQIKISRNVSNQDRSSQQPLYYQAPEVMPLLTQQKVRIPYYDLLNHGL
jgi:hypothetical protein